MVLAWYFRGLDVLIACDCWLRFAVAGSGFVNGWLGLVLGFGLVGLLVWSSGVGFDLMFLCNVGFW